MQYFYIKEGSVNNPLRVELIDDGNYGYLRSANFNNAIQNASIYFSMYNEDGELKVSKSPCSLVLSDVSPCNERYIIEYQWKKRDTSKKGKYFGKFEIIFNETKDECGNVINDLKEDGSEFPIGNLIMPIYEDLIIMVK